MVSEFCTKALQPDSGRHLRVWEFFSQWDGVIFCHIFCTLCITTRSSRERLYYRIEPSSSNKSNWTFIWFLFEHIIFTHCAFAFMYETIMDMDDAWKEFEFFTMNRIRWESRVSKYFGKWIHFHPAPTCIIPFLFLAQEFMRCLCIVEQKLVALVLLFKQSANPRPRPNPVLRSSVIILFSVVLILHVLVSIGNIHCLNNDGERFWLKVAVDKWAFNQRYSTLCSCYYEDKPELWAFGSWKDWQSEDRKWNDPSSALTLPGFDMVSIVGKRVSMK